MLGAARCEIVHGGGVDGGGWVESDLGWYRWLRSQGGSQKRRIKEKKTKESAFFLCCLV